MDVNADNASIYEKLAARTCKERLAQAGVSSIDVKLIGGHNCTDHDLSFSQKGCQLEAANAKMANARHSTVSLNVTETALVLPDNKPILSKECSPKLNAFVDEYVSADPVIIAKAKTDENINYHLARPDNVSDEEWNLLLSGVVAEYLANHCEGYVISGIDETACVPIKATPEDLNRSFAYSVYIRRKRNGPQHIPAVYMKRVISYLTSAMPGAILVPESNAIRFVNWNPTIYSPFITHLSTLHGRNYWGVNVNTLYALTELDSYSDNHNVLTFIIRESKDGSTEILIRGKKNLDTAQLEIQGEYQKQPAETEERQWEDFMTSLSYFE